MLFFCLFLCYALHQSCERPGEIFILMEDKQQLVDQFHIRDIQYGQFALIQGVFHKDIRQYGNAKPRFGSLDESR